MELYYYYKADSKCGEACRLKAGLVIDKAHIRREAGNSRRSKQRSWLVNQPHRNESRELDFRGLARFIPREAGRPNH